MTDLAKGHDKFQFTVDGVAYGTNDKTMDGSQIREAVGLTPASDFVLVQIEGGVAFSIGIEKDVSFERGKVATFLSFRSDRTYTFTVNERGWEWGAATVLVADIYRHGGIDEDLELILDSAGDAPIAPDGEVRLDGEGVEGIRSREPKTVTIKVNGRSRTVEKRRHTYREISKLAYPDADFDNFNYTITYLHGVAGAEGDLVEGESIQVKKGMVFNVRRSDKS
ncbi:multiubiquitin domain-containing protein [Sphingobium sp. LMA1-1-1.1]|uniref:multiubiquitin domain-containing protein n=1 Tax=Sphingobium sp. LMA1-1-1.1 TaxID=3135238 RepID=UPI003438A447